MNALPIADCRLPIASLNARIEAIEERLLDAPQVACPLTHHFAPGLYAREIFMPAGTFIIGHEHLSEHLNVVLSGRALVRVDGWESELVAPCVFKSDAGVRKVLLILEDMRFLTLHPLAGLEDCGQDVAKLEDRLRVKSAAYREKEQRRKEQKGIGPAAPLPRCAPAVPLEVATV